MRNGVVIYGNEPEFEEFSTVAKSFFDFLARVVSGEIVL
jgi:hypothetical protein